MSMPAPPRRYAELPLGEEVPDTHGGRKRRVHLEEAYPGQQVAACLPRVLLFSRIVPARTAPCARWTASAALKHLLAQSGPQLFDRHTMAPAPGGPEAPRAAGRQL